MYSDSNKFFSQFNAYAVLLVKSIIINIIISTNIMNVRRSKNDHLLVIVMLCQY